MLNNVMIVGRLVENPTKKELEDGKEATKITLAVNRSYKNAEGIYETDFIDCVLWNNISNNFNEYCHKGDVVGIRGRLETQEIEDKKITQVIAEKVTFLSSNSKQDQEEIDKNNE